MTYPKFKSGVSECAHCNRTIGEDERQGGDDSFVTIRDNFMIVKFFQFENGADNIFCDNNCLANYLSSETVYFEDSQ